ncbi:hypothetical protein [Simplicispira psychrophila]|uniref:hypothetical protein n=1 Tax=Simplicispira psychrophila TaxID=80882 RepID=UPI0004843D23|nr:hypothetical protein [Simplicispira psychrophila]
MAAVASLVAACKAPPEPLPAEAAQAASPQAQSRRPSTDRPIGAAAVPSPPSSAATPRAYRKDAATHLYGLNAPRIYHGKLPPLLYAIGVLEVDIDRSGGITRLHWMRAPRHAPEVVAEIERTVRAAAPFPVPARLGRVTYTDTWLWDKKGQFQLDTLTEGQL